MMTRYNWFSLLTPPPLPANLTSVKGEKFRHTEELLQKSSHGSEQFLPFEFTDNNSRLGLLLIIE